jgi:leader peptidase (prepilin peptidase)/N-methyltransferase
MAAVFGLIFGSFLNVCITRLPQGESVQHPRSHCRNCPRMLPWYENIPVFSWLALHGCCRGCGTPIPWRYPLVEAALAAMWAAAFHLYGASPAGAKAGLLCFLLLGLLFTDLETFLLPDAMTLPGIAVGLIFSALAPQDRLQHLLMSLAGAALGGGILLIISGVYYLLRKRHGLGMGDVKLLAMIGAFLGPATVLLVLFLGTIATAVASVLWLIVQRVRKTPMGRWAEHPMPYGTFLAAAGIVALFWGGNILKWYLGINS